ncbi:MAG: FixH family protein [Alphaproteobacteria bacterium]|nr:FixH family protein [Alphaproteobacteria bacterium]
MPRLSLALLGALLACSGGTPAEPSATEAPAAEQGPKEHVGLKGVYKIQPRVDPDPPAMSRLFAIEVTLLDVATGAPVEDAQVSIDAKMPQHGHGMSTQPVNEPAAGCAEGDSCPHPGGVYRTTGMKFHMPGDWTIEVDIVGPRGPDRVVFVYEMPA